MAKKGSPGAILALAAGAFFLALGWTGRYEAVWDAIRTGATDGAGLITNVGSGPAPAPPEQPGASRDDSGKITGSIAVKRPDGRQTAVDITNMLPSDNGKCHKQYERVNVVGDDPNRFYCVDPSKFVTGGGQADYGDAYAWTRLPTGTMAIQYQPNAGRMFNVD